MDYKKMIGFFTRITPLRIAMAIALTFATLHMVIEVGVFQHGPLSKEGFLHILDLKSLDVKFQQRNIRDLPEPKVVIAAIDEKSVERYGLWPWNRSIIGDFITTATQGGAKVIAFDAVFADEDRNASFQDIKRFADAFDAEGLAPKGGLASDMDKALSASSAAIGEMVAAVEQSTEELKTLQSSIKAQKLAPSSRGKARKKGKGKAVPTKAQMQGESKSVAKLLKVAEQKARQSKRKIDKIASQLTTLRERSAAFREQMQKRVEGGSPDAALEQALASSPQTIMGYVAFMNDEEIIELDADKLEAAARHISKVAISDVFVQQWQDVGDDVMSILSPVEGADLEGFWIKKMAGILAPLPRFGAVTQQFGYFNVSPDIDGPMRRVRMLHSYKGKLYPSLSLLAAANYLGEDILPIENEYFPGTRLQSINVGPDVVIETNDRGHLLLNYYKRPEDFFPTYPIADIIDGTISPDLYKDKVVLFGMTALGLFDLRPTPFSQNTPGVYIHATAIQNVIDGRYISRPPGIAFMEAMVLLILGLILGVVLKKLPPWGGMLFTALLSVVLYQIDLHVIFPAGYWILIVLPITQILLTYAGISLYGYMTEGKKKREIRKAFQFYMTKSVVDQVLENSDMLKLGGEKKCCTVLFSDIRGFTTISERLTPEQLSQLLNEYLTPMTNLVFKYDGTLDKYMGDAVMAIFGAPIAYEDSPTRACHTALDMMSELAVLQEGWRERGVPELDIGIGLNTGDMSVGNMGSEVRFDYTVMGDAVNLGARLEGINKQYGTNIIISEFTYRAVGDDMHCRELDSVKVKGKKEPVTIYELIGAGAPPPETADLITSFERGIALYKGQQWEEAITLFTHIKTDMKANDFASNLYIKRCETMREDPPDEDWDGVFTMTTK